MGRRLISCNPVLLLLQILTTIFCKGRMHSNAVSRFRPQVRIKELQQQLEHCQVTLHFIKYS